MKMKNTKSSTGWHSLTAKEILAKLKSSRQGLTLQEAEARLKKTGLNSLPEEKRFSNLKILISQFKSPLVYILLVAAAISFLLQKFVDGSVILLAVFINTIVGFVQESKAEKSLEKLKEMVEYKVLVLRDGTEKEIFAKFLVPGDIIILRAGDRIPADGRILEARGFKVNEASLTGESIPVDKTDKVLNLSGNSKQPREKNNLIYMGTTVTRGRAKAIVFATGIKTRFGKIAQLLKETKRELTPLQKKLKRFSQSFGLLTLILSLIIIIIGLWRGYEFFEIFTVAVAIAVAAIPEGLLIAVTVVLAIGMQRILKKRSLVRKLIAAETLGSTTVICTDKTGTLTEGKMQVDHILTGESELFLSKEKNKNLPDDQQKKDHLKVLEIALLCNNAVVENPNDELANWRVHGDYTEKALLLAAINAGINPDKTRKENSRLEEIPFNSDRKYMATLNRNKDGRETIYVKGAPEEILNRSRYILINGKSKELEEEMARSLKRRQNELSRKGLRVLAVAYRELKNGEALDFSEETEETGINNLIFVGFLALKDPLREGVKQTLKQAEEAGIKTVMITGDYKLTARAIANELGMKVEDKNILEGYELDELSDKEFFKRVSEIKVYARVSPAHKTRIVDAWQARGEVVAMTGDGVNDAPALKSADIGVALGSGTDVAKETSDLVLMDNNFKTILMAVEQGRIIMENIKKVVLYLLSDSFSELILISISLLFFVDKTTGEAILPLTAAQILWINIITDGFPNAALTVEPTNNEIMKEPPRKKGEPLIDLEMKSLIAIISVFTALSVMAIFWFTWKATGNIEEARTVAFVALGIDSLFYVFSCRSLKHSILKTNPFSNPYLVAAVIGGFLLQLMAVYLPFFQKIFKTVSLSLSDWGLIMFVCLGVIVVIEIVKWGFMKRDWKLGN